MRNIKNHIAKTKSFLMSHKILSVVILVLLIGSICGFVNAFSNKTEVKQITETVKKGDINVTVSGTGQVSASREISLTSKISSDLLVVNSKSGDVVHKGDVIFKIDSADAVKALRDAEWNLESAELSLEKMQQPVDGLTLMQAEDSVTQAQQSKTKAENDLKKAYDDGYTTVANAFLELPDIVKGLKDVLYGDDFSHYSMQGNADYYADSVSTAYRDSALVYKNDALDKYIAAKTAYDKNFADYKESSRYSSSDTIESLINETYTTTKLLADAVKSANNLIQFYKDKLVEQDRQPNSIADTHLTSLSSYTSKTNSSLSSLLSIKQTITNDESTLATSDRNIAEKQISLDDIKKGTDSLELRAQELAVQQKKDAVSDAQKTLSYYMITAPFDGTIASIDVLKGDSISSGTALGSIITNQKMVTVTLNEVDVTNIKAGQKVKITFDSFDDMLAEGEVAEVDTVGTVSQGVVSYDVKITFDSDDERIKPGMSATANIIQESAIGVLIVPTSAIKTQRGESYVTVLSNTKTELKKVELGLSDDVNTEIKSGLNEGDKIVTQTITINKNSTQKVTNSTTVKSNTMTPGAGEVREFRMQGM